MVRTCFAVSGPGPLAITERKIKCQVYKNILLNNLRVVFCQMKLSRGWVFMSCKINLSSMNVPYLYSFIFMQAIYLAGRS